MRLFYLSEHRSCFNYQLRYESGFSRYELTAHEEGRIDNDGCFCVLFVLKGEVQVGLGREHTISVHANRMVLIPQRAENRLTGITPAECLLLFWNKEITVCDKMYFDSISHEKPIVTNDHTLPIRKPLLHALRQVLFYLETGLLCRHMHILKQQEIILILRGFYAKNELAGFFAGASGMGSKFEDLILNNYRKVKTVKEFASLCCVSERSFNRKFQHYFNQSPYQWMQERKAELIHEKICNTDIAFREIAREQDIFCSLLTRKDGMQELAEKYGLSAKELASMYERSVEEIMDDWDAMAQERQELQAIRVRYRNCRSLLSRRNIDRTPVRVVVPFKERGIPVEYLKMLSTPLAVLEITPRILRRLREYNIYLLEDLLRFVKKNGFNALAKLHGIGMKSCEDLYSVLKRKGIMESKDNCHLFQYIWV